MMADKKQYAVVLALREDDVAEVRRWVKGANRVGIPAYQIHLWPKVVKAAGFDVVKLSKAPVETQEYVAEMICGAAVSEVRALFPKWLGHVTVTNILNHAIQGSGSLGHLAGEWIWDENMHGTADEVRNRTNAWCMDSAFAAMHPTQN
ncbi:MAG: hypothetical protein ACYDBB_04760 [Armatimonadota bacterium]